MTAGEDETQTAGSTQEDFLVSYTSANEGWAEWFAWQLEKAEYSTLIQQWDFRADSDFVRQTHGAACWTARTYEVSSPLGSADGL